jgi:ubiquitin-like protein Nedd8
LIDPNLSANAWRVIFGLEENAIPGAGELKLQLLAVSPKGYATIFDWELDEGKYTSLGKLIPPPPPPDLHVTLVGSKGGAATTQPVTITSKTTYKELLELAVAASDVPMDSIVLTGPKSAIGDNRFTELPVYENITEGITIQISDGKGWTGKLKIKTLTGKTFEIDCGATSKVIDLKNAIQDHEGVPTNQQRLVHNGRQMDDDKTCIDYMVVPADTLHLILRLRAQ